MKNILLEQNKTNYLISNIKQFKIDAKRMITKDLLKRIDLIKIIQRTNFEELQKELTNVNINNGENYKEKLTKNNSIKTNN